MAYILLLTNPRGYYMNDLNSVLIEGLESMFKPLD